jgi:TolB-like protein
MSFIKELKRRNVFKVGAAYLAVAWLIAQVSELALGSFGAPDWIIRTELFLLAVGFPLALVFAWAFELTPDGIKRETDMDRGETTSVVRGRTLDYVIIASLVLALGYFVWERQNLTGTTMINDRSIAVLPFVNRSGIAEQEWFADGLTEEIINSLTRTPDLRVASSTSSFAFKDSGGDIRTISESLGVAHILEGSVRRSAGILRIAVQLTRASDGFNLWSATFNRPNEDVIAVQEEIAIEIANALETAIDPDALAAMVSAGTHSVPAYEAYLKGLSFRVNADATGDDRLNLEANEEFARAVTIDPEFSAAHNQVALFWLAQLLANNPLYAIHPAMLDGSGLAIDEVEDRFYDAIDRAIQYEDDDVVRSRYRARRSWIDMKFHQALQLYNDYLELRPGDEGAIWDRFIIVRSLGLHERAISLALDVLDPGVEYGQAKHQALMAMMYSKDPDAIVYQTKMLVDQVPDDVFLLYQAHKAYLWAMDIEAAREVLPGILSSTFPDANKALAKLRQACAEERRSDARQFHAEALDSSDRLLVVWLAHMIIGDEDQADKLLKEYDEQGDFHKLAGMLQYGEFDPAILPNFMERVAGQGIEDREIFDIPFRCN